MNAPLSPATLKARLDVALGLFEAGGLDRFLRWIEAEHLSGREAELLLIEAMLQVVSEDGEFTAASAVLANIFRDRLTEARDAERIDASAELARTRQVQHAALQAAVLKVRACGGAA